MDWNDQKTEISGGLQSGQGALVQATIGGRSAYFANPIAQDALRQSVRGWIGTPFHGHACIRGAGVDCIHLAAALYTESGLLPAVPDFGDYDLAGGPHSERDLIFHWLDDNPSFRLAWQIQRPGDARHDMPVLHFGDLVNFRIGRQPWHVGIIVDDDRLVEVHQGAKVSDKGTIHDATFKGALRAVWRPVKP